MAYRVKTNDATVLTANAAEVDSLGNYTGHYDHDARVYPVGTVLPDGAVSPVHKKLLEEGDEHTASFLEHVDDEEVNDLLADAHPDLRALYERAAEEARLGPYPLEYGVTGPTAAPGVIDPAAAAELAQAEAAEGKVPGSGGRTGEELKDAKDEPSTVDGEKPAKPKKEKAEKPAKESKSGAKEPEGKQSGVADKGTPAEQQEGKAENKSEATQSQGVEGEKEA